MSWLGLNLGNKSNGENSTGCSGHHFEEYERKKVTIGDHPSPYYDDSIYVLYDEDGGKDKTFRMNLHGNGVKFLTVVEESVAVCEHDGCLEKDEKTERLGFIRPNAIDDVLFDEIPETDENLL